MQTIILTDNKRLSTDYNADKTLFAQKIDVNHILNTEVYQSHISRVRFWIVRPNIASQQNFVLEVCKNLVNRGNNSINFQFSISKICIGQQIPFLQQKRTNSAQDKFNRNSRMSGYLSPTMHKTIQFPPFMSNFKKQSTHSKTSSSVQWSYQSQSGSQSKKNAQTHQAQKQQQVSIKYVCKKQFQISTLNDLSTIFVNRQSIYKQFLLNEQTILQGKRVVNNYIFKQNQIQIGISVISQGCRKYLQKAINIQMSEAFNAQFNSRKQAYQTTCLTQNFSNIPKSSTKLSQDMPKQTYHKILLFLITHYDMQSQKAKSSTILANKQYNKFIQSIQEWRIKDQDINVTQKLSKQYVLIKQEIQNQKNNFKNKLKIFQAIIGQSVNVDKLLNQEKQMQTTVTLTAANTQNSNQLTSTSAINDMRVSRKSQMKPALSNPQPTNMANSSNNSQFKRLKQSFQMIRNIDNVINEQNKKIQNMKKYLKQVVKQKNQTLYKQARSLNQIKKQIKIVKEEIQQKKLQFQYKSQKLQNQQQKKDRNFVPTKQAENLLATNVKLFKKIIANQRTNKNNQKYYIQSLNEENKQNNKKQYKINSPQLTQNNKKFLIRKQYKSFYNTHQSQKSSHKLATSQLNQTQLNRTTIFTTIHQSQKQKEQKLLKKRQQQVQHHNLWMNVNKQQMRKTQNWTDSNYMSNQKEKEILMALYTYYMANMNILQQVQYEIKGYKGLKLQKMEMTLQNQTVNRTLNNCLSNSFMNQTKKTNSLGFGLRKSPSASQLNSQLFESKLSNKNKSQLKNNFSVNQLIIDIQSFPILNKILNPRVSQSAFQSQECSVISQSIKQIMQTKQQETNKNNKIGKQNFKRITIENIIGKK